MPHYNIALMLTVITYRHEKSLEYNHYDSKALYIRSTYMNLRYCI